MATTTNTTAIAIATEPKATNTPRESTSVANISRPAGGNESRAANIEQAYFTTVRVGLLVAIIYFVCRTVEQVRSIWSFFDISDECQMFSFVALFLINLNCLLNPLSYVFSFTELRARLWGRVSKCLFMSRHVNMEGQEQQMGQTRQETSGM